MYCCCGCVFFFQAEDGIRDLVRSRGLGDVYKRQHLRREDLVEEGLQGARARVVEDRLAEGPRDERGGCLLYTSDAADERSSVDLGGRRIIKKKNNQQLTTVDMTADKPVSKLIDGWHRKNETTCTIRKQGHR